MVERGIVPAKAAAEQVAVERTEERRRLVAKHGRGVAVGPLQPGDARLLGLGQAHPELEAERPGDLVGPEAADASPVDAVDELVGDPAQGERVIGEPRPRRPERRLRRDRGAHRRAVEKVAGADDEALRPGEDQGERVLVPSVAAPQIDDRLAAGERRERTAAVRDDLGEDLRDRLEPRRDPAFDLRAGGGHAPAAASAVSMLGVSASSALV
jgi:hypothetical protein